MPILGDDDNPDEMPPNILELNNCDEVATAIEAGADALTTDPNNNNIIHYVIATLDTACLELLFSAVEDDDTKRDLLRAVNNDGNTPFAIASTAPGSSALHFLTELATSLGILEELTGKRD